MASCTRLFKSVKQQKGSIKGRETTFEFLQRGGRQEAIEIREWIERWFREFPASGQLNLKRRLKGDYSPFMSALFELEVHKMLLQLNHSIEFEPNILGTNKRIDFLASKGRQSFYVEATVCGIGQSELSGNLNEHDAVEKIRKNLGPMHSDIWLEAEGELNESLGQEYVVKPFRDLLRKYTRDEVLKICLRQSYLGAPAAEIKKGNWTLKGWLMPASLYSKGQVWGPARGGAIGGATPLLKALRKKAKDWKRGDFQGRPLLIAINVCHPEFF